MEKSYWIKADGSKIEVTPKNNNDFSLEEMKAIVGGYIEIVQIKDNGFMVFNEEGKLENLPFNQEATNLFLATYPGTKDFIVGDVLICDQSLIE